MRWSNRVKALVLLGTLPALSAIGGCFSQSECPTNEEDKFFIDPTMEVFDIDGDDYCDYPEILVSCDPYWCTGVEEFGYDAYYCVDDASVRAWAHEHGFLLQTIDDEDPQRYRPNCSLPRDP